tara:strand:- start:8010 stop:8669 length:660 start_codon:yes stop_codon:yes gene_type:complete
MSDTTDSEIRLMGLIISQSALIGVAVAIFDSKLWLVNDETWMNGLNYSMGAFALQGLAYYLFKMFFERNLRERARMTEFQRQHQSRFRNMQVNFDQRRSDMELRRQEMELEKELRWMQENPDKVMTPPSFLTENRDVNNMANLGLDYHSTFNPGIPTHNTNVQQPLGLGVESANMREIYQMTDSMVKDLPTPPKDGKPTQNTSSMRLKKDGTPDLRYKS